MLSQYKHYLKAVSVTAPNIFSITGLRLFAGLSLLMFCGVESPALFIFFGLMIVIGMTYALTSTRTASLAKVFKAKQNRRAIDFDNPGLTEAFIPPPAPPQTSLTRKIVRVFGISNALAYYPYAAYLGPVTIFHSMGIDNIPLDITVASLTYVSSIAAFISFFLKAAEENVEHSLKLLVNTCRQTQTDSARLGPGVLFKTLLTSIPGTVSFGSLIRFFVKSAMQKMPLLSHLSSRTHNLTSAVIGTTSGIMFFLALGLQTHRYFEKKSNGTQNQTSEFSTTQRNLLRFHKGMGLLYLLIFFSADFRALLDLEEHLGMDNRAWYAYVTAGSFASVSTFMEWIFTCGKMNEFAIAAMQESSGPNIERQIQGVEHHQSSYSPAELINVVREREAGHSNEVLNDPLQTFYSEPREPLIAAKPQRQSALSLNRSTGY